MPDKTEVVAGTIPLRERRTLADEWKEYERKIVPAKAGPVQRQEMKRAWYGGVVTMFSMLSAGLDPQKEPTDLDVAYLESLHRELEIFAKRLGLGLE